MNTMSMSSYGSPQQLQPLDLLTQLTSRQATGCLQITSGSTSWSLCLEQGKLNYASNSIDPFGRLDRYLRRLSVRIPSLVSAVRVQARLLFETASDPGQASDYRAICWLVEQKHLNSAQAALLIEELAKEVIESLLVLQVGTYQLLETGIFSELPRFCQLELPPLVEYGQTQLHRRQALEHPPTQTPERPNPTPIATEPRKSSLADAIGLPPQEQVFIPNKKSTYTIACIDDSPTVLNAINAFLGDKDFSVVMINDPVKALMQIIRSKPDLILLDVTMPNLDGYELCSLVRKHPSFKHTPVVMVTSNTGFIDRAKARLVGASGYLTKPFTQPDLIKMVFKHLS